MPKCAFSGESLKDGSGIMYVKNDGKVLYFKNSKARKNFLLLKRNPVKTRWTQKAHEEKAKKLATKAQTKEDKKQ